MAEEGSHYQTRGDIRGGGGYGDALAGAFTLMHDSREDVKDEERNAIAITEEKRRADHNDMMQQRAERLYKWKEDQAMQSEKYQMGTQERLAEKIDRQNKIQEAKDNQLHDAEGVFTDMQLLDHTKPGFPKQLQEITSDPKNAPAFQIGQQGRINSSLAKQLAKQHADFVDAEQGRLRDQYGYDKSYYSLPVTDSGDVDYKKIQPELEISQFAMENRIEDEKRQKIQDAADKASAITTARGQAELSVKESSPEYFSNQFQKDYMVPPGVLDSNLNVKNDKGDSAITGNLDASGNFTPGNGIDYVQFRTKKGNVEIKTAPIPLSKYLALRSARKSGSNPHAFSPKTDRDPAPDPSPTPAQKNIDQSTAQDYLDKAGGDANKARELARKDGYTF